MTMSFQTVYGGSRLMNEPANQLLIVYDNYTLKKALMPAWGFSCLITLPHYQILFDTGGDPSILLENMHEFDLDLQKIDAVALSHIHGDHVGGVSGFLEQRQNITVYLPKSFPGDFKEALRQTGAAVEEIGGPQMIHPGVYTTGELGGGLKEQSLVLKTRRGLVIITGCAHPGIVEIVEHATAVFKEKVYLLIGGFHLMGYSPSELKKIAERLDALKVEKIAPCHCSGDEARNFFKDYYKDNYITCAAGLALTLPDLMQ
jgi:7,8-dihydropterin-6-yl-methyl-4-(beta-D-ribofuranosyl)aminobenzene 5'-phosphate synthase